MSTNREPENGGGNPWVKSLLIWGGIFLALLLAVSMFGGPRTASGAQLGYSDFRAKVAEGSVAEAQIAPDRITGKLRNGDAFTTVPVENDTTLTKLLEALEQRLGEESPVTLAALRERDALLGRPVTWQDGQGTGAGIDDDGALVVTLEDGSTKSLSAGEVTLRS